MAAIWNDIRSSARGAGPPRPWPGPHASENCLSSATAARGGRLTRNHIGPSPNYSVLNRHWFCHAAIQTRSILNDSQSFSIESSLIHGVACAGMHWPLSMQPAAVRATSTRWAGTGLRCPRHHAPGLGVAMAATVVRASGGPSPSHSACRKGWVGVCALSGELLIMPFASLVLARVALLTPRRGVCC